ncbi:glycosyltransferase family 2 protein [Gemmatimonas sp.]|uniref:glycosyltransferase family 2 protein n=1 Tax=Gemmatimonas sp. TaxID=1962908 RepID=UPI0039835A0E
MSALVRAFTMLEYGDVRVTAVIPARNEVHTIGEVVRETARYVHDVLVLDGGSRDGTADQARAAGARVVTDRGRGKGAAVRQSLEETTADIVVFLDADGSHDPADIPSLVRPVLARHAELCVGSRFSGGTDELSVTVGQMIRTIGNISMNIAINRRFDVALTDTLNGFRAIRREVALAVNLTENRHTIEQEMVMKVLAFGYRVVNRPTHEYSRLVGTSHIAVWREWPTFVRCVLVNIFQPRRAPLTHGTRVKPALETWMRNSTPPKTTSSESAR